MGRPYTLNTMIRNRKRSRRLDEVGIWWKRGSLVKQAYENGYIISVRKHAPGVYVMFIEDETYGTAKGQTEAMKTVRLIAAGKPGKGVWAK